MTTTTRPFSLLTERPTAFGGWEFVIDGDVQHRLVWHPEDAHLRDAATLRPFLGAPVSAPTSKAARAAAHAMVVALNAPEGCDTCVGQGVCRMEAQIGVPGSGGLITCPDCGPTPSVVVDED